VSRFGARIACASVLSALVCVAVPPAFGQGLLRMQSDRVIGAVQNQIQQAVRPQLRIRNSAGPVTAMALDDDGRVLAIVYNRTSVRIWDLQDGTEEGRYDSADQPAVIRISGDGRFVVLGTESGNIVMLAANGAPTATVRAHAGPVTALAVSRDGSVVASAGSDDLIRLWDGSGRERGTVRAPAAVNALAIAPDGWRLAAGTVGNAAFAWNSGLGAAPVRLGSSAPILAIGFAAGGRIVGLGRDGTLDSWDPNGSLVRSVRVAEQARSGELNPNESTAAVSVADNRAEVIDLDSGRVVRDFATTPGSAGFAFVDLNSRRLITAGNDGIVRIWNIGSGANVAEIISTVNGWAALDGQGRFDGTLHGVQDVEWLAARQDLPIDNFSANYYEPSLIAKSMRNHVAYVAPAQSPVMAGIYLPPRVGISVPSGRYTGGSTVDVTVTARDQGGGVAAIRLFQNGKLVPEERRSAEQRQGTTVIGSYRVPLVAGNNHFEAVATNRQQIEGEPGRADVAAAGQQALPNLDIVTIGINKYRDSRFDLNYGVPDALAILRQFNADSAAVFGHAIAYQLTDEAATRSGILQLLRALQRLPPQDVLVIYFAGHGEIVDSDWYFLPYDFEFSRDGIRSTGISASSLEQFLSRAGPQRIMIMIDSCKSGGGIDTLATAMDRRVLRSVGRDTGVAMLAAARRDQDAAELPRLGHGAFTYVVLNGLSGSADLTHSGRITADELMAYAAVQLPSLTKSLSNFMQIPVAYKRGEDFAIAR
jgi:hypothetical protein